MRSCRLVMRLSHYGGRMTPSFSCCRLRGERSLICAIALISPPLRGTTNDFGYKLLLNRLVTLNTMKRKSGFVERSRYCFS